jgi:hypothetical protein
VVHDLRRSLRRLPAVPTSAKQDLARGRATQLAAEYIISVPVLSGPNAANDSRNSRNSDAPSIRAPISSLARRRRVDPAIGSGRRGRLDRPALTRLSRPPAALGEDASVQRRVDQVGVEG